MDKSRGMETLMDEALALISFNQTNRTLKMSQAGSVKKTKLIRFLVLVLIISHLVFTSSRIKIGESRGGNNVTLKL